MSRLPFIPVFSGNNLDRLDHLRQDEDALSALINSHQARFLCYRRLAPLMAIKPALDVRYVSRNELPENAWDQALCILLGSDKEGPIFALAVDSLSEAEFAALIGTDTKAIDLRSIAMQFGSFEKDQGRCAILGQGKSLLDWHFRHKFCAVCGASTQLTRGGFQRKCKDEACGAEHFPRVDPVVIMLVIDGDRCLLGRSPHFMPNVYSALAGFMEAGESIEEAVARELKEEAGIEIDAVKYFRSQPWPFPSSLMIGVFAKASSTKIHIDKNEIEDARWFSRDEIIEMIGKSENAGYIAPTRIAIARLLMEAWIDGRAKF